MLARVAVAALLLVLVVTAVYFGTSGRRTGGTMQAEAAARDARADETELAAAPVPLDPESAPRREVAPAPQPTDEAAAPQAAEQRHRLRGVLVHSRDRVPAAGAALVFWYGEEYTEVVTGADGRFETDSVVPSRAVRVYHRGDKSDAALREHHEIRPETLLLPQPMPGGELEEVELVLVDPAAWLEVEVVTVSGLGAAADVRWSYRSSPGSGLPWSSGQSPTDAQGRARLPFPGVDRGSRMALRAQKGGGLVSDMVTVEAPLRDEPVRLVLDTAGILQVLLVGTEGKPLVGERVQIEAEGQGFFAAEAAEPTDSAGFARFEPAAPGSYRASFWDEETSRWAQTTATVERGRMTWVELRVSDVPLAVTGRVVNEEGRPDRDVTIVASIGDTSTTTSTDEHGLFSVGSTEMGPVRVRVPHDLFRDRYDPSELVVPFGTRDVLIRRLESRPTTTLALEILERGTLARIQGALVLGFVEPQRSGWSFHHAGAGLVSIELKLYDDVGLAVEAVGYRQRILRAMDLARDVPAGEACRIVLEPGLERWLQALDNDDDAPLVGARVLDGERLLATTDGDGRAAIDLPTWPKELRIRAAGHDDAVWSCKDWLSELEDGFVWMNRTPESTQAGEPR